MEKEFTPRRVSQAKEDEVDSPQNTSNSFYDVHEEPGRQNKTSCVPRNLATEMKDQNLS